MKMNMNFFVNTKVITGVDCIKNNAEKAQYFSTKTLRKVQKKIGFPERIR